MTDHEQRAREIVEKLTMEPTKGSFEADAQEWAAKCKTTDELIALIANALADAVAQERKACAAWCDQEVTRWNPYPDEPPRGLGDAIASSRQQARAQEAAEIAAWCRQR